MAHGVEAGGWGEVPPLAYLAVVLAVVVSGLLLGARGVCRRQSTRAICGRVLSAIGRHVLPGRRGGPPAGGAGTLPGVVGLRVVLPGTGHLSDALQPRPRRARWAVAKAGGLPAGRHHRQPPGARALCGHPYPGYSALRAPRRGAGAPERPRYPGGRPGNRHLGAPHLGSATGGEPRADHGRAAAVRGASGRGYPGPRRVRQPCGNRGARRCNGQSHGASRSGPALVSRCWAGDCDARGTLPTGRAGTGVPGRRHQRGDHPEPLPGLRS